MKSIDLTTCSPLWQLDLPAMDSSGRSVLGAWRGIPDSDDPEERFMATVAGLPPDLIELLRATSIAAGSVRTTGELERLCDQMVGFKLAKRLRTILRQIGKSGRDQINCDGMDVDDLMRTILMLLFSMDGQELKDVAEACARYGNAEAQSLVRQFSDSLRGSTEGEALRRVFGLANDSLRRAAERAGVSPVAIHKKEKRMRARFNRKG